MSHNTFGHIFRFTSWGESHGTALGCVVDGCPPNIPLSESDIQPWLDRRKPGKSKFVTQRKESDLVQIVSGTFDGKTTGTPISLIIKNEDARSKDYGSISDKYRPGHADIAYDMKYGIRDHRGGGRSSARETAARVAAGAIARKVIGSSISIRGAVVQIGSEVINHSNWDWGVVENNHFFCPDKYAATVWEKYLTDIRKRGSSVGAIIEIKVDGVPAGLGEPVYGKLDAEIASAIMSINAVKAVEIGAGFSAGTMEGPDNADEIRMDNQGPKFLTNNAGGILGGISTGQSIFCRFAVKPTSSFLIPRKTITNSGEEVEIETKGRHDPCVGIRAVPIAEAMVSCVLADHILRDRAQIGVRK